MGSSFDSFSHRWVLRQRNAAIETLIKATNDADLSPACVGEQRISPRPRHGKDLLCLTFRSLPEAIPALAVVLQIIVLSMAVVMALRPAHLFAQSLAPTENEVKVAFVYNFAKFVEWPPAAFPDTKAPMSLCVVGSDSMAEALEILNGQKAQGRTIRVRQSTGTEGPGACQLFYVCTSEKGRLQQTLARFPSQTLSVGDMDGFAQTGGAINFVKAGNRILFEVNIDAVQRAGLKISSQLLTLARIIKDR